jgi:ABC-type transport system substrate-binding protein
VENTFSRRSFLTHSAAAAGGIAMAGTVVDSLISSAGAVVAGVGVDSIPTLSQRGGNLTIGIGSEIPSKMKFSGASGKMDSNGFCVANAVYDPLFLTSADGKSVLPNLALSATPDASFKEWTITLRQGVTFHNGDAFNADNVVANYNAAHANLTVGLAIGPLIAGVTKVSAYVVKYTTVMKWTSFPFQLSEQQISFMAHGSCLDGDGGKPMGTGPFKLNSIDDYDLVEGGGGTSVWHKNTNYWKKDANGNSLPYLDTLTFKVIVDPAARKQALMSTGSTSLDLMVNADGSAIKQMKLAVGGNAAARSGSNSSYKWVTDEDGAREPSINSIILNTNMNYYGWKGPKVNGVAPQLSYAVGAVNPSTLDWDPYAKSVVADVTIRQACAAAIDRDAYLKNMDGSIGQTSNGIFRATIAGKKATGFYKDPKYPAATLYKSGSKKGQVDVTKPKKLVDDWKKAHPGVAAAFVIDIVAGNSAQSAAFAWIKDALDKIGITVKSRPLDQATLIQAKIDKKYDASTWSQFGGMTPDLNYVWFQSQDLIGHRVPNYVNFAQQTDKALNDAMLVGMGSAAGSSAQQKAWQTVNARMAAVVPYLWLDTTVTMWAAKANVRNFAYAGGAGTTSTSATSRAYSPDGGSARWEHIWKA